VDRKMEARPAARIEHKSTWRYLHSQALLATVAIVFKAESV